MHQHRHPELELMYAIPNGGLRSKATAGKLRAEGVKAGMPDVCLPVARGRFIGLYIEMKYGKNKPTTQQLERMELLRWHGHLVVVCWDWESAAREIAEYLYMEPPCQRSR